MDYSDRATIVGPATAFGQGGIGIIRLSGERSLSLLQAFFHPAHSKPPLHSHRLYLGAFGEQPDDPIDEVMAVYMKAPRSYTREDVVEIHCHGGMISGQEIMTLLIKNGARMAHPGEFTLRAFLNGRIDLSQAEAVMENIQSQSVLGQRMAVRHLQGALKRYCEDVKESLCDALALVEAWIDFPEEDLDPSSQQGILAPIRRAAVQAQNLLSTFQAGRILRDGVGVLILGRPNVGKSSLLNALLGSDRAIVTDIPGTTRDTLEEHFDLGGLRMRLIDSAGIRHSHDLIEQEGVRRTRDRMQDADLVLLLVDGHAGITCEDETLLSECDPQKVLVVVNKTDLGLAELPGAPQWQEAVCVSARTGAGIDNLCERIRGHFINDQSVPVAEGLVVTDIRHRNCLAQCLEAIERAEGTFQQGESFEFVALELRLALDRLGDITGETTPDDILERIFSRFCIGK